MTIETQQSKIRYGGNGTATVFPVPFPVYYADDLRLYLATELDREIVMETSAYTVKGARPGAGEHEVSVTLSVPLPSGKNLAIVRLVPLLQQRDLENGGSFDAETVEQQMDIEEMQIQQIQEQVDRAIKVPVTSDKTPEEFWQELLDAARAAIEAYKLMLQILDPSLRDSYAFNVRRSMIVKTPVPSGGILTLPAWYYPLRAIMYLSVDGMVCTPRLGTNPDPGERQYDEIGATPNTLSSTVRIWFPIEAGMVVDVWVVASNLYKELGTIQAMADVSTQKATEAGQSATDAVTSAATATTKATAAAGISRLTEPWQSPPQRTAPEAWSNWPRRRKRPPALTLTGPSLRPG